MELRCCRKAVLGLEQEAGLQRRKEEMNVWRGDWISGGSEGKRVRRRGRLLEIEREEDGRGGRRKRRDAQVLGFLVPVLLLTGLGLFSPSEQINPYLLDCVLLQLLWSGFPNRNERNKGKDKQITFLLSRNLPLL